jgi:hypothetical protein
MSFLRELILGSSEKAVKGKEGPLYMGSGGEGFGRVFLVAEDFLEGAR